MQQSLSATAAPAPQVLALIDCNSFYASCEKLFRPDLRHRPVVVLSNNDGCVIARSSEAKALGIPMGAPFFKVKPQIRRHRVACFSSNYALYADISQRVMSVLSDLVPELEVYSIDEAFLELTGLSQLQTIEDYTQYGQHLRQRVYGWVGVPIGVGIAPTKTLAKLANYAAKRYPASRGVVTLLENSRRDKLLQLTPVEEIWGIGRRLAARLQSAGIRSAWDLAQLDPEHVRQQYSVVLSRTIRELNGEPCLELEDLSNKKQIISSRTFGRPVTELHEMQEAISEYTAIATAKLRQQQQRAKLIGLFIQSNRYNHDSPFYYNHHQQPLLTASDDTRLLSRIALQLLKSIWRPGYRYNKAGVMLCDFYDTKVYQGLLFDDEVQSQRGSQLMQAIDHLNEQHANSIRFASQGIEEANSWRMRRRYLSPAYTTRWQDIPSVI